MGRRVILVSISLCLIPGLAHAYIHHQRNRQLRRAGHLLLYQCLDGIDFVRGGLDDEFIVYLQDQPGFEPLDLKPPVDPHHSDLDDVGGSALDGGIHCHPVRQRPW